ncbi:Riean_0653 family protein [Hymenobacter daeguensis]
MNHFRKPLLYLCLLTLTQCTKCKQTDPTPDPPKDPLSLLPPETQNGAGTFGCLVNGQAMSVNSAFLISGDWSCNSCLTIASQSSATQSEYGISLLLAGALQNNQGFTLARYSRTIDFSLNQFSATANVKGCYYSGNFTKTGQVQLVKFDPVARVASGRFAFTLYEPGGCDTLRVTNGRFDVKF